MSPSVANPAFIAIPLFLLTALIFGTVAAWCRSGASREATVATMVLVGLAAHAWLQTTWMFAERGTFQDWSLRGTSSASRF